MLKCLSLLSLMPYTLTPYAFMDLRSYALCSTSCDLTISASMHHGFILDASILYSFAPDASTIHVLSPIPVLIPNLLLFFVLIPYALVNYDVFIQNLTF